MGGKSNHAMKGIDSFHIYDYKKNCVKLLSCCFKTIMNVNIFND